MLKDFNISLITNPKLLLQAWVANFERPRMNANSLLASPTGLSPYLRFGCLSCRLFYFKLTDLYRKVKSISTVLYSDKTDTNQILSSKSDTALSGYFCSHTNLIFLFCYIPPGSLRWRRTAPHLSRCTGSCCGASSSTQPLLITHASTKWRATPYACRSHGTATQRHWPSGPRAGQDSPGSMPLWPSWGRRGGSTTWHAMPWPASLHVEICGSAGKRAWRYCDHNINLLFTVISVDVSVDIIRIRSLQPKQTQILY